MVPQLRLTTSWVGRTRRRAARRTRSAGSAVRSLNALGAASGPRWRRARASAARPWSGRRTGPRARRPSRSRPGRRGCCRPAASAARCTPSAISSLAQTIASGGGRAAGPGRGLAAVQVEIARYAAPGRAVRRRAGAGEPGVPAGDVRRAAGSPRNAKPRCPCASRCRASTSAVRALRVRMVSTPGTGSRASSTSGSAGRGDAPAPRRRRRSAHDGQAVDPAGELDAPRRPRPGGRRVVRISTLLPRSAAVSS